MGKVSEREEKILGRIGGFQIPYIYSSDFEKENPFFNTTSAEEEAVNQLREVAQADIIKRELEKMIEEQMKEFEALRDKVRIMLN